jgi:hypothetical protein
MNHLESMTAKLNAIGERYTSMELTLRQLQQFIAAQGWNEAICEQINRELEDIRTWGQQAWAEYQAWPEASRQQPVLREKLQSITGQVANCLLLVQNLEREAKLQRDRLLPQVHTGVQALRMQQAYAAS